jgi:hypothetical protein
VTRPTFSNPLKPKFSSLVAITHLFFNTLSNFACAKEENVFAFFGHAKEENVSVFVDM